MECNIPSAHCTTLRLLTWGQNVYLSLYLYLCVCISTICVCVYAYLQQNRSNSGDQVAKKPAAISPWSPCQWTSHYHPPIHLINRSEPKFHLCETVDYFGWSGVFLLSCNEQFSTIIRQQKDKTQDFLWNCLRQIHFERSTDAGRKTSITHRHKTTMEHKHISTQTQSQRHSMLSKLLDFYQ